MEQTEAPRHLVKFKDEYYSCLQHVKPILTSDGSAPLKFDIELTDMIPATNEEAAAYVGPCMILDE